VATEYTDSTSAELEKPELSCHLIKACTVDYSVGSFLEMFTNIMNCFAQTET
jgi:hypothetical protein